MCYWPYIHELVDIAGQMYRGTQTCRVIFITERIRGREHMLWYPDHRSHSAPHD